MYEYAILMAVLIAIVLLIIALIVRARAEQPNVLNVLTRSIFSPLFSRTAESPRSDLVFGVRVVEHPPSPPSAPARLVVLLLCILPVAMLLPVLILRYYNPADAPFLQTQITADGEWGITTTWSPRQASLTEAETSTLTLFNLSSPAPPLRFAFDGYIELVRSSPNGKHLLIHYHTGTKDRANNGRVEILSISDGRRRLLELSGVGINQGSTMSWLRNDRFFYADREGNRLLADLEGKTITNLGIGRTATPPDSLIPWVTADDDSLIDGNAVSLFNADGDRIGRIDGVRGRSTPNATLYDAALYGGGMAGIRHMSEAHETGYALTVLATNGVVRDLMSVSARTMLLGGLKSSGEIVLLDQENSTVRAVSATTGTVRRLADLKSHGEEGWVWNGNVFNDRLKMEGFTTEEGRPGGWLRMPDGRMIRGTWKMTVLLDADGRVLHSSKESRNFLPVGGSAHLWVEWSMMRDIGIGYRRFVILDAASGRTLDLRDQRVANIPLTYSSGDNRIVFDTMGGLFTPQLVRVFNTESWQFEPAIDILAEERSLLPRSGWTYASIFLILLAMGFNFSIYRRRTGRIDHRVLIVFSITLSLLFLCFLIFDNILPNNWRLFLNTWLMTALLDLLLIGLLFLPVLLLHLVLIFPPQDRKYGAIRQILVGPFRLMGGNVVIRGLLHAFKFLLYMPPCLIIVSFLTAGFNPARFGSRPPAGFLLFIFVVSFVILFLYLLIALYILVRSYMTTSSRINRQRHAIVVIGTLIGLLSLPGVLIVSGLLGPHIGGDVSFHWALIISPAIILLSHVYGVYRHQLLDE